MHPEIEQITTKIIARSDKTRATYLSQLEQARLKKPHRSTLQCGNLAHGFAACSKQDKQHLQEFNKANIAIISAYNDLLSAHQPYESYPALLKAVIQQQGGVAQFAGGVPAMCDGITQGQPGMELSLLSRDVIAMAASISLAHNMFDGGLMLGICDKIVPGLLIAALRFGHLPFIFVPAGPMPSGISNKEKAKIREKFAEGNVSKATLLATEAASYHSPGTCTFYGTANSNQLLMELMGLQLPGSSFINPNTPLRSALTQAAAAQILQLTHLSDNYLPLGQIVDAKVIVNAIVGLLATGGSTNHTMHLVAIARAAGLIINWDDFAALSKITPLIARIYPNGEGDINQFQQAGGMAFLIRTLLDEKLLHEEVNTIMGFGLRHYTQKPALQNEKLAWIPGPIESENPHILTSTANSFKPQGGLQVLNGNIGRAIIKTSALSSNAERIKAPAKVFNNQEELLAAFYAKELNKDCVVVIRFQGPKACGMPELHQLTPLLGTLQNQGFQVALITDGRMSGASGKIPAAIHVSPEAWEEGLIAKIQDNDLILLDSNQGILSLLVSEEELKTRLPAKPPLKTPYGMGRELFNNMRLTFTGAEKGACTLFNEDNDE